MLPLDSLKSTKNLSHKRVTI